MWRLYLQLAKVKDRRKSVVAQIKALTHHDVLVGIPRATAPRQHQPTGGHANNALIGYIMDNGSPLKHIPRREWLRPGIRRAIPQIVRGLQRAGVAALAGDKQEMMRGLHQAGLAAQSSVRSFINAGNFTPLAASTLAARRRRGHKSTKPLVEYGEFRNSVTYVVR